MEINVHIFLKGPSMQITHCMLSRHFHRKKFYPLVGKHYWKKHLWNNNYQMYVHKWMINLIHYFLDNNNRITINTILVYMYILKRIRLTPKMTTANCHVIWKWESFKWPGYFPLCEDAPISFIIIHDGIKRVVVNRKSKL